MKFKQIAQIAIAALAVFATDSALAQKITIIQKDGQQISYNAQNVEKILFEKETAVDETNLLIEKYVPDAGFRNWIDQNLGNGSGYYSLEDAAAYNGQIDLSRVESVTDITGIEYFTSLTRLIGEDSYFGDFNVGALTNLTYLKVVNTKCTTFDLSSLNKLESAMLSRNLITSLKLPSGIKNLYCDTNQLTELDLTGCTNLQTLVCSTNNISSLVLPECPLVTLAMHTNPVGTIDLSPVKSTLDLLNVNKCNLTALDLNGCDKLTYLECSDNTFTEAPNFAGCTKIETIRMENNPNELGTLDFSDCKNLNTLRIDFSKIGAAIDFSQNRRLYEVSMQGCNLTDINVSNCINLGYLNVTDNLFTRLDISACDGLWNLYCNNCPNAPEIKVWPDFDIAHASDNGFYCNNGTFVYEFTDNGKAQDVNLTFNITNISALHFKASGEEITTLNEGSNSVIFPEYTSLEITADEGYEMTITKDDAPVELTNKRLYYLFIDNSLEGHVFDIAAVTPDAGKLSCTVKVDNAARLTLAINGDAYQLQNGENTVLFEEGDTFNIGEANWGTLFSVTLNGEDVEDFWGFYNITPKAGDVIDIKVDYPDEDFAVTFDCPEGFITAVSVNDEVVEDLDLSNFSAHAGDKVAIYYNNYLWNSESITAWNNSKVLSPSEWTFWSGYNFTLKKNTTLKVEAQMNETINVSVTVNNPEKVNIYKSDVDYYDIATVGTEATTVTLPAGDGAKLIICTTADDYEIIGVTVNAEARKVNFVNEVEISDLKADDVIVITTN